MADSETMSRLARLEEGVDHLNRSVDGLNRAMIQVSEILLDQNQRLDRFELAQRGTNDRLDRLIELQTRSYTDWVARHESHEGRIARLEARVDRLEK
jgi:hypothetical protein